jgi:DNA-binding IclR family transcriptional regulator
MMPAHCTAAGKAILAHLSSDELRRIYSEHKLEPIRSRSLTSMADLEAQLEQVRERGYATNFGESESDVAAVAVPVPGRPGDRRLSITISAPLGRLTPEQVPAVADAASRAAAELQRRSLEEVA